MKLGILLAAFGANTIQAQRALTLFDCIVREKFPGIPVRWAYTSLLVRKRLAAARIKRDSVSKALQKMRFEKFTHIAIQPLQTIPGSEHEAVLEDVASITSLNTDLHVEVGTPLLACKDDVYKTAKAIVRHVPKERKISEPVLLMGHGAEHMAVQWYENLAMAVHVLDGNIHVGTMNGAVHLEDILPKLPKGQKVWLMPLLSVVGRHTLDDMAGNQHDSWRSRIIDAGFVCEPVLRGTAEYEGFINIWLEHLDSAMQTIT